jgi:hypothetical protein
VLCLYVGGTAYSYPDYVDAATGRMLEPQAPATVYDVRVAPGRNPHLPLPPGDGRWIAVSALEPQAEPAGDETPEPEPETPAEVPPDGAESPPEAPEGEPAPEDAPEPDNPAEEAPDPEGSD